MHDFMKTILLAIKEWVNKRIKNNTPNWNENDPEADGYIKNRPFYTKKTSKILADNVSVEVTEEGNPLINMLTLDNIIEGQTYNIIWDDIEYNCVGYIAEGPNAPSIGNGTLIGASGGNGEPFFITVFQGTSLLFAEVGTHRISIATNSVEVKKISKEYLPDNIYVQSDWNVTDETNEAFIKNKPVPDSTLTIEGAAADAKTVGDALAEKQPIGDYALKSEIPTVPTKVSDLTNDAGYATEAYVNIKVAGLVDSAPETLDTLNELAAALGDDPNFATTLATQIGAIQAALTIDYDANLAFNTSEIVFSSNTSNILGQAILGQLVLA
jgi:hypothetical protein